MYYVTASGHVSIYLTFPSGFTLDHKSSVFNIHLTVEPSGGVNGGVAACFPFVFSPNFRTKTLSSHFCDG